MMHIMKSDPDFKRQIIEFAGSSFLGAVAIATFLLQCGRSWHWLASLVIVPIIYYLTFVTEISD